MTTTRRSYTTKQLADELGVSVQSVKRWIDAGHVKAWKTMGGHRKIDPDSAAAFIRSMKAHGEAAALEGSAAASAQPTVLAVDDDPNFLTFVEDLTVEAIPCASVSKAGNGFIALQELARAIPDILVTDVLMPHVDGIEMLKHLAEQQTLPAVVIVTSLLPFDELERRGGLPAGAVYLPKPLEPKAFIDRLRAHFPGSAGSG